MFIYLIFSLLLVFLVFLSAWFSGTESAFSSLSPADIAEIKARKWKKVDYIIKIKSQLNKTVATLLILNNLVKIIIAALVALFANKIFQAAGLSVAIGVITFIITIFGEINPKARALANRKAIAHKRASGLFYLVKIMTPVSSLFIFIANKFLGLKIKKGVELTVSQSGIKNLVSLGEAEGSIQKIEKNIIWRSFDFGRKKARDVMTPMKKVFTVNLGCHLNYARKNIFLKGFTRVPVLNKDKKVVGLVYLKDIISTQAKKIDSLVKRSFIVCEDDPVSEIFRQMRRQNRHFALVRDKDKKKDLGILTMEDLVEILLGQIRDEHSKIKEKALKKIKKETEKRKENK